MSSSLLWFDESAQLLAKGNDSPGTNVFEIYSGPFSHVKDAEDEAGKPGARADLEMLNCKVFKVSVGSDEYASVVLCRIEAGKPQWTIYCGDDQIKGAHRLDGKNLAAKLRREGKVSNPVTNTLEASDWVGTVPSQAQCGFFRMLARSKKFCAHTAAVLKQLQGDDLDQMATDLVAWQSGAATPMTTAAKPDSAEEEAFYDAAFIQHAMLAGERGSGKTYLARQAANRCDAIYLEMQMHPSMEPWEFRAHDRAWNGKVYTVLGKLAEAVYWIQQGKKVVLCMDEFLNMNPMYTTAINTPLSLTANDTYLIDTGRIIDMGEGIGTQETVEVPADKFWVVATTNIGARYGLDKIAPSVRARFQIILMNTNADRTRKILEKQLAKYEMPLELGERFEKFINGCNQAVDENLLDEEVTTRFASNVLRSVHLKALRDKKSYRTLAHWLPVVKKQVLVEIAQVVNFELGPLDEEQKERFLTVVNACFK